MTLDRARRAYQNDPTYRLAVDSLTHLIEEAQLSPSEVRECAMLAVLMFEQKQTHSIRGFPSNLETLSDEAIRKLAKL